MALLELIGRLGLNTGPFEAGLKRAKKVAHSEGQELAHIFQHVGLGLLGIHSVGRTLEHVVRETINWSKDIDKAREEFERLGIEIDEGALRSIRATGIELERLKAQLGIGLAPALGVLGTGMMLAASSARRWLFTGYSGAQQQKDLEREQMAEIGATTPEEQKQFAEQREKDLGALRERLAKVTEANLMAGLDDEAKKSHLIERHLEVLDALSKPMARRDLLLKQIEAEELKGQIESLDRKPGDRAHAAAIPRETVDSLARVGGFAQVQQGFPQVRIVEQIVTYMQATARNTERLVQQSEKTQFDRARDEFYEGFRQL